MNKQSGHDDCVSLYEFIDELLSFNEIVILGDGYDGKNVEKIIAECIKSGENRENKPSVKYCLIKESGQKDLLSYYIAGELARHNNADKALIVCYEFETAERLYVNLIKSNFGRIVKGKLLLNCWYQNICFHVLSDSAEAELVDDSVYIGKSENSRIKELCTQLYNDKSVESYLAVVDYYSNRGNFLLAYDYCLRAMQHFCDERIVERKEYIGTIIEKSDISLLDYINAMEKYIDVAYFGRSGSIYFQSLLEGHSGIITIPAGIIYFPYHRLYSLYYSKRGYVTVSDIVRVLDIDDSFILDYSEAIEIKAENNIGLYPLRYDEKYKFYIENILNEKVKGNCIVDEKFLIQTMYLSHHLALGRTIDYKKGIPYILNHLHTSDLDMEDKLLRLFSDVTVLCTVRNVVQNFGSNINSFFRRFDSEVTKGKIMELFLYYSEHPLFNKIGKDYKIFFAPLEKVNINPSGLLRKILGRLDLEWEDVLMVSTINGIKMYDRYEPNAAFSSGARTTGIDKLYDEYLDSFDRFRLEVLYSPILSKWNYPCTDFIDMEYIKKFSDIPFRFEKEIKFEDDAERDRYRNKIKRLYLHIIEHRNKIEKDVEKHEIL